jgi:hypothetical protein
VALWMYQRARRSRSTTKSELIKSRSSALGKIAAVDPNMSPLRLADTNLIRASITTLNDLEVTYMKTKLIILACAFITPLAFGQTKVEETTTVTKTAEVPADHPGKMGTVASFIPGTSITINQDAFTHPTKYQMAKGVAFTKPSGAALSPDSIQPGTRVGVRLNADGQVDQITLLDPR